MTRQRLPDRRASTVFGVECNGLNYTASASWFDDGRLGEVFIGNHRAIPTPMPARRTRRFSPASHSNLARRPTCLCKALLRDSHGRPSTPIGCALDLLSNKEATP